MASDKRSYTCVTLSHLPEMLAWVRSQISQCYLPKRDKKHIEIALEEALVNIIDHAYQGLGGEVEICFNFEPDVFIEFLIIDQGAPFNPLDQEPHIEKHAPLLQRKIGGLGIPLMRELMDDVRHYREAGANYLVMKKSLA